MATHSKSHGKRPARPVPAAAEGPAPVISIMEEIDAAEAAEAEAAAVESVAALPVVVHPPASESSAEPEPLHAADWSMKAIDVWSENATAFLDLAESLGKAKSLPEAFEIQSRFASERYESFVKRSGEFAEIAQRLAAGYAPARFPFAASTT